MVGRTLDTVIESSCPAWVADESQRITQINDQALELFGQTSRSAVIGQPCYTVVGGRHLDGAPLCQQHCPVFAAVHAGESAPAVKMLTRRASEDDDDGAFASSPQWVPCEVQHVVLRPSGSAGNSGMRIIHVARDLRRMQAVLQFSELVMSAAHRLVADTAGENPMRVLTPQERRVLAAFAEGHDTAMVAGMLGVSRATVRNHTQHLLRKLGCHSRIEAIALVQPFLAGKTISTSERALDLLDI